MGPGLAARQPGRACRRFRLSTRRTSQPWNHTSHASRGPPGQPGHVDPRLGPLAPVAQLSSHFALLCHVVQHLLRRLHSIYSSRDPAVRRRVDDGLPYLELRQAVVARSTDVDRQFRRPVQCHEHAYVEETPLLLAEAGPRPRVAPAPLRHELCRWLATKLGAGHGQPTLSCPRKLGGPVRQSAVDVFLSHHATTHLEALVEQLLVELVVLWIR